MLPGMSFYEHAIYRVPFESFSPVSPPEFCDEPLDVMHRGMSNRPAESESKRLTCIGQLFQHSTKKMFHLLGALKKMLTTQSGIPSGTLQGFMTGNSCMGCGLSPWKSLVSYIISPPENCDLHVDTFPSVVSWLCFCHGFSLVVLLWVKTVVVIFTRFSHWFDTDTAIKNTTVVHKADNFTKQILKPEAQSLSEQKSCEQKKKTS